MVKQRPTPFRHLLLLLMAVLLISACSQDTSDQQQVAEDTVKDDNEQQAPATDFNLQSALLAAAELDRFTGDLDQMRERRVIRALVTYSPTDFFIKDGAIRGIQADLLQAYEDYLNKDVKRAVDKVRIKYIPVTFDQLFPALEQGVGDIAAAMLTVTPERQQRVSFVSGGQKDVKEILVRHKEASAIASLSQLSGKSVYVLRDSSYAEHLQETNQKLQQQGLAEIKVIEGDSRLLSEDILELVNAGVVQYSFIDDYKGELWQQVLDDLRLQPEISLSEANQLGWAVRPANTQLQQSLSHYVKSQARKGTLLGNMLIKRYFGTTRWIKNPLSLTARDRLLVNLPLFVKYGQQYDFDPLALAAIAFQESGLRQNRKSHRGAVGMMQLLPSTAADPNVAIPDIRNKENNVHAGAKYLAFVRDRYLSDPEINRANQMFFTLAAYNAGPAKLRKMRAMAGEMGLDQNRWFGHVELAAARLIGRETVDYVSKIYKVYIAYKLATDIRDEKQRLLELLRGGQV